jgi:hypothetical protein
MHTYKIRFWFGEWRVPENESVVMADSPAVSAIVAEGLRKLGYSVLVMHYSEGGTYPRYSETKI